MFDVLRLVRENRATTLMLLFLLGLYAALFVSGLFSAGAVPPIVTEDTLSSGQLKEKEAAALKRLEERPGLAAALSFSFTAVLGAGLALDAWLLWRSFRRRAWLGPAPEKTLPRWGLRELTQTVVFLFFVEGVLFTGQTFWFWATGLEKTQHDLFLLGNSLLRDLFVAAFVARLAFLRGQSWRELGFRMERFWANARAGVVGYVAMVPPMLLGFVLLAMLMQAFSYEPLPQDVVQIYLKKNAAPVLFVFTLFVAVLGPVLEEFFFRGFAYPALRQKLGAGRATVLVAAVFAAFHMNLVAFLPIFLLGIFLTYLYEATGSLVPCITAHILHNTLMVAMTLGFRSLAGAS